MAIPESTCSFCHQPASKVAKLIASDGGAHICNYCVALSYDALVQEGVDVKLPPEPPGPLPTQTDGGGDR